MVVPELKQQGAIGSQDALDKTLCRWTQQQNAPSAPTVASRHRSLEGRSVGKELPKGFAGLVIATEAQDVAIRILQLQLA